MGGRASVADLAYGEVCAMTKDEARSRMLTTYPETSSINQTARDWHASRQVIRSWVE